MWTWHTSPSRPPHPETGACDTSIVEGILDVLPEGFTAVIKSTVVPGTTQAWHDRYPHLKIAYSPEFLVERQRLHDFANQDILVCGTHMLMWLKRCSSSTAKPAC